MAKIYVGHDDIRKLSPASFVDVYLALLPDVYAAYREKLYGKKYKYRLSDSYNTELSFQFKEESVLHLFGISVDKIRDLFEEYYDLLSIGYDIHDDKGDLFFFIEKIIKKKVCIREIVHEVEGYRKRDIDSFLNNFDEKKKYRGSNARKYSFVLDLRDCLSDYSFEKMEALTHLSECIDIVNRGEFAITYPTFFNSEYGMCYRIAGGVISLGIGYEPDGDSFVNTIRFNTNESFASSSCTFSSYALVAKSCECEKKEERVPLKKNYTDPKYFIDNAEFFKNNGINYDLNGLCLSVIQQFCNAGVQNVAQLANAIAALNSQLSEARDELSIEQFKLHNLGSDNADLRRQVAAAEKSLATLKGYINCAGNGMESAYTAVNVYMKTIGKKKFCFKEMSDFLQFCNSNPSFNVEFFCDYFNSSLDLKKKYPNIPDIEEEFLRNIRIVISRFYHGKRIKFRYINGNTRMDKIILTKRKLHLANIICNSNNKRLVNSGIQEHSTYSIFRGLRLIDGNRYDCLHKVYVEGVKQHRNDCPDADAVTSIDVENSINMLVRRVKSEERLYSKGYDKLINIVRFGIDENREFLFDEREKFILTIVLDSLNPAENSCGYSLHKINSILLARKILPTTVYEIESLKDRLYECRSAKVKKKV